MPFEFQPLNIPEIILVSAQSFTDERGYFMETFKRSVFAEHGISAPLVQDNLSSSHQGVIRGLHFQKPPRAQGKLVMCLRGEIFDVALDIRKGSPHYGKWVSARLSEENKNMLWVPEGFAHGFQVLSKSALVFYKVTDEFSPAHELGIRWNDPEIGIEWPVANPTVSARDAALGPLAQVDSGFIYSP
ncbi:MAG: dTDP-4-dehydrorhamnose 3,5-epimerase [Deinococcus sp.]|nr:dTDP-4-dehydrorhamnose 3,5-epimerase [Deinococcus sp.]MCL5964408.1 dTDP-4-dehydrorhamnose 3,5-epimerase [Deinococcus sp.]